VRMPLTQQIELILILIYQQLVSLLLFVQQILLVIQKYQPEIVFIRR